MTRFNNKTWIVWQVHHAATADIIATSPGSTYQQNCNDIHTHRQQLSNLGMTPVTAGSNNDGQQRETKLMLLQQRWRSIDAADTRNISSNNPSNTPLHRVMLPMFLPGTRCYTDASTDPDQAQQLSRPTGLGVFIINTQQQLTISMYIKATMPSSTSVIMAEAAALALAASLISAMHMQAPIYLTDNQQLVNFYNRTDHSSPPHWSIKFYTQKFNNHNSTNN